MQQIIKSENLSEIEILYKTKVKAIDRPKVVNSEEVYDVLKKLYDEDKIEHVETCILLLLNKSSRVLRHYKVSVGGVSGTVVDPKLIFQAALAGNSSRIIVSHNHPSGELAPSSQDIAITKKLRDGGKLLEIDVLDHIIVTVDGYYSLADNGLI